MEIFIYYQILLALQSSNDNLSRKKTNKKDMILTFGDNFFLTGVNFYFSFLFLEIKNCIQFCCQSVKFFFVLFCCCLTLFIFIMIVPMMMIMIMITSWILIITIFTFLSFTSLLSLATLFILLMIIIPSMMMMLVS